MERLNWERQRLNPSHDQDPAKDEDEAQRGHEKAPAQADTGRSLAKYSSRNQASSSRPRPLATKRSGPAHRASPLMIPEPDPWKRMPRPDPISKPAPAGGVMGLARAKG